MSTVPNAYGNFLANLSPFVANYASFGGPNGTFVKPGGRVAAYVRSTGAQDGDDQFAASGLLVASINEGLKRCRSGMNDIVYVLPGHTETYSSAGAVWANLVAGSQVVSAGVPGAASNPTLTLSQVGASIALNVADVSLIGFNIRSSTAALTAAIVITGAGCVVAGNSVICTGAGGANSLITVTAAANAAIVNNFIVQSSTATIVTITGAGSTNYLVHGNMFRQTTSGAYVTSDANATGVYSFNFGKSSGAAPAAGAGFVVGAAANGGNYENYSQANAVTAGVIATGA